MDTKICILCLTNSDFEDYQSLCPTKIGNESLTDVLRLHFWEVQVNERLIIMCKSCLEKVTTFHEFYLEVRTIHDQFKEPKLANTFLFENVIKEEPEQDSSTNNLSDNVEYNTIDRPDEQNDSKIDVKKVVSKSDNEESPTPSTRSKKVRRKPSNELPARKSKDAKPESWKVILEKNYDKFLLRFSMQCQLCTVSLQSLDEARKHYRSVHNRKGYLMCSDCDRPFSDYGRIVDHLEWHDDPEKFICTTCNKTFVDGTCMRKHIKEIHAARMYKCDQCDETFTRRNPFVYHMKTIHPENENIECNQCKKKFKIKESLRYHIRKVHENSDSRICDICAKFFKCSKAYELHYKVVHTNTMQKVKCDICGSWLKHVGMLKEHMNWQHKRQNIPQTCKYCGKTTTNRKSLMNHIRCHHSNISYTCHICDKSFKQTLTLKEHMAIHSGDKELYTCSYCPRTFRSRANMYAHRKKAHPIEYQQSKHLKMNGIDVKLNI